MAATTADVQVENHGSIVLVRPLSDEAASWLHENTDGTWWGGALAGEPRYVDDLLEGMLGDGFELS
jgi:hypothetical protein